MKRLSIPFFLLILFLTACASSQPVKTELPTIAATAPKVITPTVNGNADKPPTGSVFTPYLTPIPQRAFPTPGTEAVSKDLASLTYTMCINNTSNLPQAKDCCDCLSAADAATIKNCRDVAAKHDFSLNSGLITFTVPSALGQAGNYTLFTAAGNQQDCKQLCDSSTTLACGDRRFCRTACDQLPVK